MSHRVVRLRLAFDGAAYCGWQRQTNATTVQGVVESALGVMLGEAPTLHGSGRTDAGVHALGMVAHFNTVATIPCYGFLRGLNSLLPADVRVVAVDDMAPDFHSRFSALGKTYHYFFSTGRTQQPTDRHYSLHLPGPFDLGAVRTCLATLVGTHDFRAFEGGGERNPSRVSRRGTVRTLFRAQCLAHPEKADHYHFSFYGDGFLRYMVRNLAGTLFEVAKGRYQVDEFQAILKSRDDSKVNRTAPPHGLFLVEVFYP